MSKTMTLAGAKEQIKAILNRYSDHSFALYPRWTRLVNQITTDINGFDMNNIDTFKDWVVQSVIPLFKKLIPGFGPELKPLRNLLQQSIASWPTQETLLAQVIEELCNEVNTLQTAIITLENDVQVHQSTIQALAPESLDALRQSLDHSQAHIASLAQALDDQKTLLSLAQEAVKQHEMSLQKEREESKRRETVLNEQMANLSIKSQQYSIVNQRLNEKLLIASKTMQELNTSLQQKNTLIMEYHNTIVTLQTDNQRLQSLAWQLSTQQQYTQPVWTKVPDENLASTPYSTENTVALTFTPGATMKFNNNGKKTTPPANAQTKGEPSNQRPNI